MRIVLLSPMRRPRPSTVPAFARSLTPSAPLAVRGRTNCTLAVMRQAVITRRGPPDVIHIRETPDRTPGAGELRIAVRAAGVNFADVMARLGLYPDAPRLPAVVGYEVAGIVDAIGDGVDGLRVGDRALALTRFGGYSSAVTVPAAQVLPVPPQLTD